MTNSSSVVSTPTPAPCFGQCPKENNFFGGPFIGSYRIWLARNSQEWSAGELIKVKA